MTRPARRRLALLGPLLALLALPAAAQLEDPAIRGGRLPAPLVADFAEPGGHADSIYLQGDPLGDRFVKLEFAWRNDTEEPCVVLRYRIVEPASSPGVTLDLQPTPFLPTAICKEQGFGRVLFVAGWEPATDRVVIERWTIGDAEVVAGKASTDGATEPPTLSAPPLLRKRLLDVPRDTTWPLLEGLAYQPVAEQLYALTYGPDGRVLRLDANDPSDAPELLTDATKFQDLATASDLRAYLHTDGGLLIVSRDETPWGANESDGGARRRWVVFPDADLDGGLEEIGVVDIAELKERYPGSGWRIGWRVP